MRARTGVVLASWNTPWGCVIAVAKACAGVVETDALAAGLPDPRTGDNFVYTMADISLSAFGVFFTSPNFPSKFLSFPFLWYQNSDACSAASVRRANSSPAHSFTELPHSSRTSPRALAALLVTMNPSSAIETFTPAGSMKQSRPMTLGFVSAILHDQTLEQVFAFAEGEGFQCVELMCWPKGKADRKFAGVTHLDVDKFDTANAEETNQLAAQHGVQISALGFYPNALHPDAAISKAATDHLKKVILAAEKLRLNTVNTFIGRDWTKSVEENWSRFLKIWKPLISFAADHGVRIAIENCAMIFTRDEWPGGKNLASSPAIWRRMFADIDSPDFGLNYDPSHPAWMQMDWLKPLHEFRAKLFHIHAKDIRLDRAALDDHGILAYPLQFHQPRIPGFGEIDWGRFIGTLMQLGYTGPVCIEVEDDTFGKTLAGRQRALRTARNVLAPYFDLPTSSPTLR